MVRRPPCACRHSRAVCHSLNWGVLVSDLGGEEGIGHLTSRIEVIGRISGRRHWTVEQKLEMLRDAIDERVLLVSIGFVNNEIGAVQPIQAISRLCRDAGALLHSNAAQALCWNAVSVDGMGVDLLSLSGHKTGGPKGIGALYVGPAAADRLRPITHGGGQELGLRPGTVPTPLCVGFGAVPSAGGGVARGDGLAA